MAGADCLSGLSDDLLASIISLLPTREAVRTTVLSRRWSPVWLHTDSLIMDTRSYGDKIVDKIDRLFADAAKFLGDPRRCSQVKKLSLFLHGQEQRYLVGESRESYNQIASLLAAPALQSVEEVRVEFGVVKRAGYWEREEEGLSGRVYELDPAMFPRGRLRVIELVFCKLLPPPQSAIQFPRLSSLQIYGCFSTAKCLEGWIRATPSLRSLHILYQYLFPSDEKGSDRFLLDSPSLTDMTLMIGLWPSTNEHYVLDVPMLQTYKYKGNFSAFSMKSETLRLARVSLDIEQIYDQTGKALHVWFAPFWKFLRPFQHVKVMELNVPAIEGFAVNPEVEHEYLLDFPCLERLELIGFLDPSRSNDASLAIADLLHCCPMLHHLQIQITADYFRAYYADMVSTFSDSMNLFEKRDTVPLMISDEQDTLQLEELPGLAGCNFPCMQNHLKKVKLQFDMKELNCFEVRLAKFFAENCIVLEELVIDDGKQNFLSHVNSMVEGWRATAVERRNDIYSANLSEQSRKRKRELGEQESASSGEERNEAAPPPPHLDVVEDLYSRLCTSDVLVSGLNGLGAEIAKNLTLAGVKSVTIHDVKNVEMWNLSGNFFLSEDDVGKNRAIACVAKLEDLNNVVNISALTEELTKEHPSKFQVVVFTDIGLDKAYEFNEYCRSHQPPISFIKSEACGLFGNVFCDFGPKFDVLDVDGEDPHTGMIASISNGNPARVSCNERLEFQDGDLVIFSEVHGMAELNDGKPRKVKKAMPFAFTIEEDTSNFGIYIKGGIVKQVKEPKVLCFKALRDAMRDPGDFLLSDFSKFDRPRVLHLAFEALDRFKEDYGRFPAAGCEQDAQSFIKIASAMNEASADLMLDLNTEKLLCQFASGSRAVLNPMAAMFGGIVGQEVVKACSGKFHPLYQFFYFDSVQSLPTYPLDPQDLKPSNSRYDAQVSIFGSKLQKKLEEAKSFVVGSGALGCEFLKNLALMGLSCSSKGKLTITDDDIIERSNLSSQFLFRDRNIGQAKSTVAATAASAINPLFRIDALQNHACLDTKNVFHDAFWEGLDVVISALDNVNTRMYMETRCLYFQKPLLKSGLLGVKCNTQMMIPHITENYGASSDPYEQAKAYSIPEVGKVKAKFIATSTAMATGLVCLELYKVIAGGHPVEDYRNTVANLGLPSFSLTQPLPPKLMEHKGYFWTAWDRWAFKGDQTLAELLQYFSDYGLTVWGIFCGASTLYNNGSADRGILAKKVVDVARKVAKLDLIEHRSHFDIQVICDDEEGNPVNIPLVSVSFS